MYLPFRAFPDGGKAPRPAGCGEEPEKPRRSGLPSFFLVLGLTLSLAGRPAVTEAATLANHMDAWESASLWCQDQHQRWAEHRLSGPLDPEQRVIVDLPSLPCFFLEVGLKESLLSFSIPQELRQDDALEVNYSPYGDLSLDVSRRGEPLFSAEGTEKDRELARDPDRNPPDPVEVGPLLAVLRMDLPKAEGSALGLPYRTVDESFELRTALVSEGVVWKGSLYFYEDKLSVAALSASLTERTLEKVYAELAFQGYRHAEEKEEAVSFTDDPALDAQPAVRQEAVQKLLADLAAPEAEPYEVMFLPCALQKEDDEAHRNPTMQVQLRIAPGAERIKLTLSTYEVAEE